MDTDRNLLFAVLALQAGLLDRDRFVQACTVWASRKDVALSDLVIEQGWLSPDDRADVQRLLDRKLTRHGGDARASLAAVTLAETRQALDSVADVDVAYSVASFTGRRGADEAVATTPHANGAGRNVLYEEIGRGGIGRVLRGRDPDLGRELAVKVLRDEYRDNAGVQRRFVEEAQVGGQLQHPGVVPVYELGRFPDRRPYFTMKLVKGRTLAELLKERPDPGHELAHFLTIFEQVCQAVAYAHSKGVIHRDLKPANVMVGAFGEVQVMDWGLAKVLASRERERPEDETTAGTLIRTVRSDSTAEDDGRTGVVGTPSYMAPEQARADGDAVDERADVFGLGAILCIILTGQPPFAGASAAELLRRAAAGDLAEAFARLESCGADADLVALCRACLAPGREDRPRDAGEVTARVAAYQAAVRERLRQAELQRAAAEARAGEERKRRRVQQALAVAVLALVAAGAGVGLWAQRHAAERRQRVESALDRAVMLRQQAHWGEAQVVLEQAQQLLGDGPADLRQRLDVAREELALVNRLDTIRQLQATWIGETFDTKTAEREYTAAFHDAGLGDVGDDEAAVAGRVRVSGVAGPLIAALDDWALATKEPEVRSWLLAVARQADPDPWRDRVRQPDVWRDKQALRALADEVLRDGGDRLAALSPQLLHALAQLMGGAETAPFLRAAQSRHPTDFWLSLRLGSMLYLDKQAREACGYFRVAVAVRPETAVAHYNLGVGLQETGDPDAAVAEYRVALALDPRFARAHIKLGGVLELKADRAGAEAAYRSAVEAEPDSSVAHNCLGSLLHDRKDLDGALAEFRKAIEANPQNGYAHYNLAVSLTDKQDLDGALAACRTAVQLVPEFAPAHYVLGNALFDKKDLDGAVAAYRKAIELDPNMARAHHTLGDSLRLKGDLAGAAEACQKAIALDPKDGKPHYTLGQVLEARKDLDGAIGEYRKATAVEPTLAPAQYNLGKALQSKGHPEAAIAPYRAAIALVPRHTWAHYNLGLALYETRDLDGAAAEFRRAAEIDPDHAEAHCNLGHVLREQGRLVEALPELRRGHELGSKRPGWEYPSAEWLRECERLVELDRRLPDVLAGRVEPGPAERVEFAGLCQVYRGRHAAAVRLYAEAFAAAPKLAADPRQQLRYDAACSAALAAAGKGEDAKGMPDRARLLLRRLALGWLRADLAAYRQLAERGDPDIRRAVRHWQTDPELAPVRDPQALARLPDDERRQWQALWDDVAALVKTLGAAR
jgi:serine/threonine-protein kinase